MDQNAAFGLVGVVVGAMIGSGSSVGIEWWRARREQMALTLAVATELEAVAHVVRTRGWIDIIRQLQSLAAGGNVQGLSIHLNDDHIPVTRSAAIKVGLLQGNLPELISRFLVLSRAFFSDIERFRLHPLGTPDCLVDVNDPAEAELVYKEVGDILEAALGNADQIVWETIRLYPHPRNLPVLYRIKRAWRYIIC